MLNMRPRNMHWLGREAKLKSHQAIRTLLLAVLSFEHCSTLKISERKRSLTTTVSLLSSLWPKTLVAGPGHETTLTRSFFIFQTSSSLNLTYVEGQSIFISCSLNRPLRKDSSHKVSFLRLNDFALLFVGSRRHTRDQRIDVSPATDPIRKEWTLQVRNAKQNDSGVYECQLNTQPNSRSILVWWPLHSALTM